jgi:hypothetical protein
MIRHVLTFGGGALVARGYVDSGTVEAISGALMTIIGAVWSIMDKRARS